MQNCVTVEEGGGGERIDETHLSAFHSISNRAHGKRLRNSISSVVRDFCGGLCKRLYDVHVT